MGSTSIDGINKDQGEFPFPKVERKKEPTFQQIAQPLWTQSKATLVAKYLKNFCYVTRHGTYLDAFAGPQRVKNLDMWSAKLVLDNRPRRLRHFHFFERNRAKVKMLQDLKDSQPPRTKSEGKGTIDIYQGDCNRKLPAMLAANPIKDTEATFCLLDQWTRECDWATVKVVAEHKKGGKKIELFYFFPQGWIDRSVGGLKDTEAKMVKWWGRADWRELLKRQGYERGRFIADRFKAELGYAHAQPFPIYGQGRVMYFMIHASDDDRAIPLMFSAYNNAMGVKKTAQQIDLLFADCMGKQQNPSSSNKRR